MISFSFVIGKAPKDGASGWVFSLSPSNIAIGDNSDGSLDLTNAKTTVSANYGNSKAAVAIVGNVSCVNCTAEVLDGGIIKINTVSMHAVSYTYNGTNYTSDAYYPNGYVLIPVKGTLGSQSSSTVLRLDFTVSGYIGNKVNDFKIAKVITDNNATMVQVSEIKQTADKISAEVYEMLIAEDNLLTNTKEMGVTDIITTSAQQIFDGELDSSNNTKFDSSMISGTKYMISFDAKKVSGDGVMHVEFHGSKGGDVTVSTTEYARYGVQSTYDGQKYLYMWLVSSGHIKVRNVKVSKSTVVDAWTQSVNDIKEKLLPTGVDIENKRITATADTLLIKDNSGNTNTIFENIDGNPMMKSSFIQADKITAQKMQTSTSGERTEIINDMISQYNDSGELMVRIHGGMLSTASGTVNLFTIPDKIMGTDGLIISAPSSGLVTIVDVPLTTGIFDVQSLNNIIEIRDSASNNVGIECSVSMSNNDDVKSIGYELYISGTAGTNLTGAYSFPENLSSGYITISKGINGTAVLSSQVAESDCKLFVRFRVEFSSSNGTVTINNTNGGAGNALYGICTYGGNVTEIAKDGFCTIFGNYGIKITAEGIQKTSDGGANWTNI